MGERVLVKPLPCEFGLATAHSRGCVQGFLAHGTEEADRHLGGKALGMTVSSLLRVQRCQALDNTIHDANTAVIPSALPLAVLAYPRRSVREGPLHFCQARQESSNPTALPVG